MDEKTLKENALLRKDRVDEAIEFVCGYFERHNLNLYEQWHVCECIGRSALAIMNEKANAAKKQVDQEKSLSTP